MKLKTLLRTSTFRLALIYMLLFGGSVLLLFSFIYWATVGYMAQQTDATIEAEIQGLDEQYRQRGLNGLMNVIQERSKNADNSVYFFAMPDYTALAGNLNRFPKEAIGENPLKQGEWLNFEVKLQNGKSYEARAQYFSLIGGLHLLVGRNMYELHATKSIIIRAFIGGFMITLALALVGGMMMTWSIARRLESINQTSREIMTGDLSRRIPTRGTGDDFDQLADNLNLMLDQIVHLMEGIRHVTDNIAHDLRTPLTRLRQRLEQMRSKSNEYPAYLDNALLEQAIQEVEQLLSTFNALLRITRLESGSLVLNSQNTHPIDLKMMVQDAVELYEVIAQEKHQRLTCKLSDGLEIFGERDMLFQVLANLLDNAIKYTPERGLISVSARRENNEIHLVVADDGAGIPEDERDKVLQRFYRLERSRSTVGNGLGLSLVAAIVRFHHGELRLESNEPGLRVVIVFTQLPPTPAT